MMPNGTPSLAATVGSCYRDSKGAGCRPPLSVDLVSGIARLLALGISTPWLISDTMTPHGSHLSSQSIRHESRDPLHMYHTSAFPIPLRDRPYISEISRRGTSVLKPR